MDWDTVATGGEYLWDIMTWRYLPILVLLFIPITVYYMTYDFTLEEKTETDAETGEIKKVLVVQRKQGMLLTAMAIGIPVFLWFTYLFLIGVGV